MREYCWKAGNACTASGTENADAPPNGGSGLVGNWCSGDSPFRCGVGTSGGGDGTGRPAAVSVVHSSAFSCSSRTMVSWASCAQHTVRELSSITLPHSA